MDAGWHGVTLEQLLRHEGGAPADLDAGGLWEKLWKHQGSPTSARRLLLTGVTSRPPANPIGDNSYSNAGYAIAGHMAETASGQAWEELMREKLFRPLEMNSAGFGAPGTSGQADQPRGHQPNGTPVEPGLGADNPVAIGPAGIVHCTLGDYAKFLRLHLNGANGRAELLSADSFKKLHTAPNGRQFAMGWIVAKVNNSTIFAHSGSNTMWFCTAWIIPDQDIAVAVACNQAGPGEKACDEAIAALWQQYARR
jgi:CubicO group peptidase (beta-lactamase class C family)